MRLRHEMISSFNFEKSRTILKESSELKMPEMELRLETVLEMIWIRELLKKLSQKRGIKSLIWIGDKTGWISWSLKTFKQKLDSVSRMSLVSRSQGSWMISTKKRWRIMDESRFCSSFFNYPTTKSRTSSFERSSSEAKFWRRVWTNTKLIIIIISVSSSSFARDRQDNWPGTRAHSHQKGHN